MGASSRPSHSVVLDEDKFIILRSIPGGSLWFDSTLEEKMFTSVSSYQNSDLSGIVEGTKFGGLADAHPFIENLFQRLPPDDS